MDEEKQAKTQPLSPWLIIMATAPVPLILFLFFFYKWYQDKSDLGRVTSHFVQRQNQVIAYDAVALSREVAQLLETAVTDARGLSLIPVSEKTVLEFARIHESPVTVVDSEKRIAVQQWLPRYNRIVFLKANGNETLRLEGGSLQKNLRTLSECREKDLCDRKARERAVSLSDGQAYFGNLMRYYIPEKSDETGEGSYTIMIRSKDRIIELGIDYRHFRSLLFVPTFPYQQRTDLLRAHQAGNYVYLMDINTDVLVHPRYCHVTGIDRSTGTIVSPVITDADVGTHRLNVKEYRGEKLKEYFERLLTRSLIHKSVDIFRSPNLVSGNLVLTVAPVLLSKGQFEKTGVFGHVVIGCSVDYFEEPREQFIPYY